MVCYPTLRIVKDFLSLRYQVPIRSRSSKSLSRSSSSFALVAFIFKNPSIVFYRVVSGQCKYFNVHDERRLALQDLWLAPKVSFLILGVDLVRPFSRFSAFRFSDRHL